MLVWISIFIAIILTTILCSIYYTYYRKSKYAKDCTGWACNRVGQICKPDSPGADNQTWICDGATWHQVINPQNMEDMKEEDRYVKQCDDWSCNRAGQICPPNASSADNRFWICDGETWHQAVRPY